MVGLAIGRKWVTIIGVSSLALVVVISAGCVSRRNFTNDPVKWSLIGGDGSWDAGTRRWTVYLSPGETKSARIGLYNTSPRNIVVLVAMEEGADFNRLHLESPSIVLGDNGVLVRSHESAELTISDTADDGGIAPKGSHRYVVDLGWSTDSTPRTGPP